MNRDLRTVVRKYTASLPTKRKSRFIGILQPSKTQCIPLEKEDLEGVPADLDGNFFPVLVQQSTPAPTGPLDPSFNSFVLSQGFSDGADSSELVLDRVTKLFEASSSRLSERRSSDDGARPGVSGQ